MGSLKYWWNTASENIMPWEKAMSSKARKLCQRVLLHPVQADRTWTVAGFIGKQHFLQKPRSWTKAYWDMEFKIQFATASVTGTPDGGSIHAKQMRGIAEKYFFNILLA